MMKRTQVCVIGLAVTLAWTNWAASCTINLYAAIDLCEV